MDIRASTKCGSNNILLENALKYITAFHISKFHEILVQNKSNVVVSASLYYSKLLLLHPQQLVIASWPYFIHCLIVIIAVFQFLSMLYICLLEEVKFIWHVEYMYAFLEWIGMKETACQILPPPSYMMH